MAPSTVTLSPVRKQPKTGFPKNTIIADIKSAVAAPIKSGNLYLLLILHFEAFALPTLSERATQKPTPICTT